ncbi:MAG: hypothetical protein ACKO65_04285 [Betaproteobacteria bacterium]
MTISNTANRPAYSATPDLSAGLKTDRPSALLAEIKNHEVAPELALKALWRNDNIGIPVSFGLNKLASECSQDETSTKSKSKSGPEAKGNALQDRLALTRQLVRNAPHLKALSARIDLAIISDGDAQARVSDLIEVHLRASDKIAESRTNVFFGFLHLVKMTIKAEVTDRFIETFAKKTVGEGEAREAAFSKAVNQEARALLASHIFSPPREVSPATVVNIEISEKAKPAFEDFRMMMNSLPADLRSQGKWQNVEKRMEAYFNHTIAVPYNPVEL